MACRIALTSEWTTRILHESIGKVGSFMTLTYNDENLPANGSLVKAHLQKFIKRLRKFIEPEKIKYYGVGEYGEESKRPHYHIIIIGWKPDYKMCYRPDKKQIVSRQIEKLWRFGHNSCGNIDREAIQYVCGYVRKKLTGDLGDIEYRQTGRIPPFSLQSLGLGLDYALAHKDQILSDRGITRDGKKVSVPRYYLKKLIDKDSEDELNYQRRCFNRRLELMLPYGDVKVSTRIIGKKLIDTPVFLDGNSEYSYCQAEYSDRERRRKALLARKSLYKTNMNKI